MHAMRWRKIVLAVVSAAALARPAAAEEASSLYRALPGREPEVAGLEAPILVDVRDPAAYVRLHIPGALHIPAYALKTKVFLRDAEVVLVDAGWGDPALERVCANLRAEGWRSVHILRGGVSAWARAGRPLEGDEAALAEWDVVMPAEILAAPAERPGHRWWIACREEAPEGFGWTASDLETARSRLAEAGGDAPVLVCTDDDMVMAALRAARDIRPEGPDVYFVKGGSAAWRAAWSLSSARPGAIRVASTNLIEANANGDLPCAGCPAP